MRDLRMKLFEIYVYIWLSSLYLPYIWDFASLDIPSAIFSLSLSLLPFAYCLRGRPLYFVVLFPPRRHAVVKLDETRYRIERAITASSRVGARLLTRLYVAERLNCTVQRELTPAKTASSSDAPRGRERRKNNRQSGDNANREKRVSRVSLITCRGSCTIWMSAKKFTNENYIAAELCQRPQMLS